jgi:hypothetical protein
MLTIVRSLVGLLVVAGLLSETLAEDNELVGRFGDFSRLEVEGLASFTAEEVRDGLRGDFDALLAGHPLAPLSDLPVVVRERLLAGFLNEGFAEAVVEVHLDREHQRLRAVVREGPAYVAGSVRVEGAAKVPVDPLTERLTKPYPPREAVKLAFGPGDGEHVQWKDRDGKDVELSPAVWSPGDPARLAPDSKERTKRKVKFALEGMGYRFAKFQIDLESDSKTRTADLVVHLEEEGPKASLDDIEIVGNKRNTKEAILKYLNLKEAALLTRAEQTRIEYELWRSGRFIDYELTSASPDSVDDPVKLQIKVTESSFAPPIDQPLSREQQVLLKMREWLANPNRWQADMVLELSGPGNTVEIILAPARGALATIRSTEAASKRALTIVVSKDVVGYCPATVPTKLEGTTPPVEFKSMIDIVLDANPADPQNPFRLNGGFEIENKTSSEPKGPIVGAVNLQPAAAVAMAREGDAKTGWDGDTLIVSLGSARTHINAGTGALLRFRDEDGEDATEITFRKGAYEKRVADIRKHTSGLENGFDPDRPVSSFLGFFCREEVLLDLVNNLPGAIESKPSAEELEDLESQLRPLKLAQKLLDAGILEPIDGWISEANGEAEREFDIPTSRSPNVGLAATLARGAVTLADDLFPRDSWLWTLWREAGFTVAGEGEYTGPQLEAFYESHDFGPVCYLAIGALLERVQPRMTQLFASRGLRSTDAADFRKDYEPLLDRRFVIGACLHHASMLLRELHAEEVQGIAEGLPDEFGPCLQAFAAELQKDDNRTTEQAIPAALDRCWDAGLKLVVETQLRALRDRNSVRVGLR